VLPANARLQALFAFRETFLKKAFDACGALPYMPFHRTGRRFNGIFHWSPT
jgi:hypothetical protein